MNSAATRDVRLSAFHNVRGVGFSQCFSKISRAVFRQRGNLFVQHTVGVRNVETKTRVFISYSRKDMEFADKLEAALKARGFEVLIDREEIYAFEDWWKRIQALIGGADTVVFVLSPDAVKSDVALKEVTHAASLNKRFAPIVCRRVDDAAVPEALRRLNFIFFDDPDQFEASADRLADALQTDIAWVRRHTEFGDTAHQWLEAGRPSGMLLRPPVLDQAEAWLAFRPGGAPAPTAETETLIAQSRKAMLGTQRLRRIALASIFALMMSVILGLVGWINQAYIADQWRRWTVTRPYAAAQVWPHVLSAAQEQALKPGRSFKECAKDCPEMVVVPAGSYTMGGTTENRHTVTFAKPFAISKYELTFADWDACVVGGGCNGYRPSDQGWGRSHQPVINVDWDDAQQYVAWLSQVTGKTYRLLSEAEYEYAARAGTTTTYPWGDDIKFNGQGMANCDGCGSKWDNSQTAPVGSFPPNEFGLYDMVGNVLEWTEDCAHTDLNGAPTDGSAWLADADGNCTNRIVRGGSWSQAPNFLRLEVRAGGNPGFRVDGLGFRVARTLLAP
jgi:formylglycine-generating enzyme required for sulfatase activity